MFDIAWSEIMLIALVALIFIGPKELPHVLYGLGRALSKLRRSADEFKRQFDDSMRDAGYGDFHRNFEELRQLNPANQLRDSLDRAMTRDYPQKPPVEPPLPGNSIGSEGSMTPASETSAAAITSPEAAERAKDHTLANGAAPANAGGHSPIHAG